MWRLPHILLLLQLTLLTTAHGRQSTFPANSNSPTAPGVKAVVTKAALQYGADTALKHMTYRVHQAKLPDASGTSDITVGKVDWSLTNIVINSVSVPQSRVLLAAPSRFVCSVSRASLSLTADWRYKVYTGHFKILSDHGSLDMMTSDAAISMTTSLGASLGQPVIKMLACDGDIGRLSVQFHGGAAWVYNVLKDIVWHPVKDSIQSMMCKAAGSYIDNDGSAQLANLKLVLPIGSELMLNYSLVAPPQATADTLKVDLQGGVTWTTSPANPPFIPDPIPDPEPLAMVTMVISDYLLNSLSYTEYVHNKTMWYLTRKDLNPDDPWLLNTTCGGQTTCLGNFLVQVAQLYPGTFFELDMRTAKLPVYASLPDAASVQFAGEVHFYVRLQNGSRVYLFSAAGNASLVIAPYLNGTFIKGVTKSFMTNSWVTRSAIGKVYNQTIQFIAKAIAKIIINELNRLGDNGLEIPSMKHVTLVNPKLNFTKGIIGISSDVRYDDNVDRRELPIRFEEVYKPDTWEQQNMGHTRM